MTIKVFIKRHLQDGKMEAALPLLNQFRSAAMEQSGYIAGETLVNHYDPRSVMVAAS